MHCAAILSTLCLHTLCPPFITHLLPTLLTLLFDSILFLHSLLTEYIYIRLTNRKELGSTSSPCPRHWGPFRQGPHGLERLRLLQGRVLQRSQWWNSTRGLRCWYFLQEYWRHCRTGWSWRERVRGRGESIIAYTAVYSFHYCMLVCTILPWSLNNYVPHTTKSTTTTVRQSLRPPPWPGTLTSAPLYQGAGSPPSTGQLPKVRHSEELGWSGEVVMERMWREGDCMTDWRMS